MEPDRRYRYVARAGRSSWDPSFPLGNGRYGQECRAVVWSGGPGPRNVLVEFGDGSFVVVPGRTLRRVREV